MIDYLESSIYNPKTNISIAEPSYIWSSTGNVKIVEGTTITNESGTWSHKIKVNDKRIKLSTKCQEIELDVIEKADNHTLPVLCPANDNSFTTISNLTINEENFSIIFSDDFSYLAIPFSRHYINVKSRGNVINKVSIEEQVALDTLREMITEKEFRKYLRYGFIWVKSQSRNIYQIFRNHRHIKVWKNGILIEEICITISNKKIPLTDNVIAFKVMIETNEEEIHKFGNVYPMRAA